MISLQSEVQHGTAGRITQSNTPKEIQGWEFSHGDVPAIQYFCTDIFMSLYHSN